MSKKTIVVQDLSKRYLIGHRLTQQKSYSYLALRDVLQREIQDFVRKAADVIHGRQVVQGDQLEEFWALRNVNFDVEQGEILGVVGRNGAGKSTLLKVLSRITEPTEGKILLRGRVASLLEVGTGFHPELTGRENIFLNGAILGMTQREILRKFDEIVSFAEVEKFIDTPVKHYSSGMHVRLAFGVAAHLEPEILIIDEVLAVGDAEFQKKCLGKMDDVSRNQGRTVLFVSHNIEAVTKLCTRCILLNSGVIQAEGDVKSVLSAYLTSQPSSPRIVDLLSKLRSHDLGAKARLIAATPSSGREGWSLPFGQALSLDISIDAHSSVSRIEIAIGIFTNDGFEVASWTSICGNAQLLVRPGINKLRIEFQNMRLHPGHYSLGIGVRDCLGGVEYIREAVSFEIVTSPEAAKIDAHALGGAIVAAATVSS
jgi:lipopolysaccharide transport system ATP-binding protein